MLPNFLGAYILQLEGLGIVEICLGVEHRHQDVHRTQPAYNVA